MHEYYVHRLFVCILLADSEVVHTRCTKLITDGKPIPGPRNMGRTLEMNVDSSIFLFVVICLLFCRRNLHVRGLSPQVSFCLNKNKLPTTTHLTFDKFPLVGLVSMSSFCKLARRLKETFIWAFLYQFFLYLHRL